MLPVLMHFESSPRAYRGWDLAARRLSKLVGKTEGGGGKIRARTENNEIDVVSSEEEEVEEVEEGKLDIGQTWGEDEIVYREFCDQ